MSEKPTPDFSMDALLRELQERASTGGEGATTAELSEILNKTKGMIRKELHRLKKEGRLLRIDKRIEFLDGRVVTVPAYKLKE